jgi:hypothetical protein
MPTLLLSFKKTSNGRVMFHGFTAPTDREAEKDLAGHAAACPEFGPAHRAGETIDVLMEIDSLPKFDESAIEEWIDELVGAEGEEDEDEEEAEEDEEENVEEK